MIVVILIGIIIFLFWAHTGKDKYKIKEGKPYSDKPSLQTTKTDPLVYPELQNISIPQTISVAPKSIKTNPNIKLSLIDGEHRTFQNYYIGGIQYTFGFPKSNCKDKRVWIGIGKKEVERITHEEAISRILSDTIAPKQINTLNTFKWNDDLPF